MERSPEVQVAPSKFRFYNPITGRSKMLRLKMRAPIGVWFYIEPVVAKDGDGKPIVLRGSWKFRGPFGTRKRADNFIKTVQGQLSLISGEPCVSKAFAVDGDKQP